MFKDNSSATPLLSAIQVLLIFVAFVATMFIVIFIKKIYYRFHLHKKINIIPQISTKDITNIAMNIAMSIAIIIILTLFTAGALGVIFRAYPGTRILIEGILIQLSGLLFGPILGLIIGALTDLLSICLTAGMFHYGYFIIAIGYGLFSGLIRSIYVSVKQNKTKFSLITTLLTVLITGLFCVFILYQPYQDFKISAFNLDLTIKKYVLTIIPIIFSSIIIVVIWLCNFFFDKFYENKLFWLKVKYNVKYQWKMDRFNRKAKRFSNNDSVLRHTIWISRNLNYITTLRKKILLLTKQINDEKKILSWFDYLCPCLCLVNLVQLLCNCFLIPFFDVEFSSFKYDYWLVIRTVLYPIIALINLAVIYSSYRIAYRLINR